MPVVSVTNCGHAPHFSAGSVAPYVAVFAGTREETEDAARALRASPENGCKTTVR